jgi:hypothetical protein
MDFGSINWLAVLACVVFSMISGSLWFGPKTFFPVWWKAIGMKANQEPMGSGALVWVLVVVSSLVQAVFMALLVNAMGSLAGGATLVSGMTTGFLLWLGFVATTGLTNKLFAGQYKAWLLETGNHLINFVVFGAILGAWH